ncbi:MAG TPA: hypothetical protein VK054_00935 [Beutenbergiaceae bacterium]|nr:hypothetical protein [Beutenbergiaceae bacterium]
MTNDKPKNVVSLKGLDLEALGEANDARVPIPGGGGFILFPDPYAKPSDEVGEYLERLQAAMNDPTLLGGFLKEYLPAAEHKKFVKAFPLWKQQVFILGKVEEHFASTMGDVGEGDASAS